MCCRQSLLIQFTIIVLATYFIQDGLSIQCWKCRSDSDPKCGDPFDNSTLHIFDCAQAEPLPAYPLVKSTMCRKIRQKVNGQWRVDRSCAFLGEPGIGGDERFCLMRTGTYNIFIEYCTCSSKDGCNTAPRLQRHVLVEFTTLIILPALTLLAKY
ncbi:hypothetical protein QAD02_000845 [Eretmocerus hayati]|uniref:Uncharacterized protein n=1 Tax=Eretmocerus hayati TaxID=131215 RepID=A0ACC2NFB6_9HYME|nr:hypothetical protein QAD02_000845 [Eretmocerus hayati]